MGVTTVVQRLLDRAPAVRPVEEVELDDLHVPGRLRLRLRVWWRRRRG